MPRKAVPAPKNLQFFLILWSNVKCQPPVPKFPLCLFVSNRHSSPSSGVLRLTSLGLGNKNSTRFHRGSLCVALFDTTDTSSICYLNSISIFCLVVDRCLVGWSSSSNAYFLSDFAGAQVENETSHDRRFIRHHSERLHGR